jgi:hypothetical protein
MGVDFDTGANGDSRKYKVVPASSFRAGKRPQKVARTSTSSRQALVNLAR